MDCQKCQDLLSDYLDASLAPQERVNISRHLNECFDCLAVCDDLKLIVSAGHEQRGEAFDVPQAHAMWLRISNVIESEQKSAASVAAARSPSAANNRWSGMFNRRWEFSLPQMVMTLAAIVIAVSLGTVVGLRVTMTKRPANIANNNVRPITNQSLTTSANPGDLDGRLRPQQASMEYWNKRVEERKGRWNPQMRDAFERNMSVIDLTVNDAITGLRSNPHDDVAEEMLEAAMKDKMELLKEFSEY